MKAGRPVKSVAKRMQTAAKVVSNYDALNVALDAIIPLPKKAKKK